MLTDNQISALQNELIDIYSKIEIELIVSVAKRLSNYDEVSGSLNWELKKLSELNVLSKDLMKIIQKYTSKTNKAVENMLKKAMLGNVDKNYLDEAFKEGLAAINYKSLSKSPTFKRMLNTSIYELNNSLSMINSKAIETAKESYVKVLNKAYAEVATGTYSYSTAIQKGIKEMAKNGIKGATYESGRSIGIEPAIRRDTLSAFIHNVNQSTIVTAKEVGTNYVEVSEHLGARVSAKSKIANHAGWQGKVYMIEGSSDEYGNLVEETGYGDIEGLGGNDGCGFGGNGFVWAFLIFALLGFGGFGNGFGGRGAGIPMNNGNLATKDDVSNQFNFAALERQNNEIVAEVRNGTNETVSAIKDASYNNLMQTRDVQASVAAGFADMQKCCCETQRGIDSVNYNNAINTASINANTVAQTQKVLDAISQNRFDAMQNRINQLELQSAMCGVVRYPNGMTYNAGNSPFCNSGNGYSYPLY